MGHAMFFDERLGERSSIILERVLVSRDFLARRVDGDGDVGTREK